MKRRILPCLILVATLVLWTMSAFGQAAGNVSPLTDAQVRELMIKDSIAHYSGSCPCPYNHARNGSRCGARSAYSKPGGQAPLCYPEDITDEMVRKYRAQAR